MNVPQIADIFVHEYKDMGNLFIVGRVEIIFETVANN